MIIGGHQPVHHLLSIFKINDIKNYLWIYADLLSDMDSINKYTNNLFLNPINDKLVLVVEDIDFYIMEKNHGHHHQQQVLSHSCYIYIILDSIYSI